jgi:NAD(P)H-nitrite reductase large subunit
MLQDGEKGVVIQRDKATYAVAPHLTCGVVDPATLRKLADVAEQRNLTIKVTGEQRIALIGLREEEVDQVWAELGMAKGHVVGNTVRGVKACPGTDFCKRALQNSLEMGRELDRRYHGIPLPGKMKLGVSGCPFQCSETNFKDIGLVGKAKGWNILIGGNGGGKARIAQTLIENVPTERALELVEGLVQFFKANSRHQERMGRVIERVGMESLRAALGLEDPTTALPQTAMMAP